jgi:hypothetical protein
MPNSISMVHHTLVDVWPTIVKILNLELLVKGNWIYLLLDWDFLQIGLENDTWRLPNH